MRGSPSGLLVQVCTSVPLGALGGVLKGAPPGDNIALLGAFNSNSINWRGVTGRTNLNPCGVLWLDICIYLLAVC